MIDEYERDAYPEDRCCDNWCRSVNGCNGHTHCAVCGECVCGIEVNDDGMCADCAAIAEQESEEEDA